MSIGQSDLTAINNSVDTNINIDKNLYKKNIRNVASKITKRAIDIIASIVGTIMLVPITLFVAICNMLSKENGPLFFTQKRIGQNGKIFKMYKYRTMVVGAEEILQKHIQEQTEIGKEYLKNKKIKNDPRITKIGKFLRKTSLDEFPQFINVLKGEMTLVGPRPYLPMEKEDMAESYLTITKMKPGLTGPWQVSGRNNLSFQDRLELDSQYATNRNLAKDIKMIFLTIKKIVKKEGAM